MSDDFDDELLALAGGDEEVDIEEGEASSVAASSPNSLGSGDMDESDSDRDDDVPARDSDVPYPLEGKFIDQRDKQHIMGLSQLEREEILGQRAEEMSKANFQAEVLRRAAMNNRKRKADSEEPEDSQRKSSRQVKPKRTAALEAYNLAREQKGQQRQRIDDRRKDRRRSSSAGRDGGSDVDAEGEEDVDWDEGRKSAVREDLPVTLRDVESIRIGRGFFGKVCFWPGFEQAMIGAFGRVGVGQTQDHPKRTLYRMAQIKGFQAGKPYVFEGKNGEKIATDQYVICKHGATTKEYQFQYLSNQRFTDADFDAYRQAVDGKLPPQSFVSEKIEQLKAFENRLWTDDDINERIAKSNKYLHLLHRDRDESAPRIPTQSEVAANRLAELNRQNREAERERVRKLQLEQRQQRLKAKKRAEIELRRKKAEEEEKRKAEEEKKNHLSVDDLFDDGSSRANSMPREGTSTPQPEAVEKKKKEKTERKGLPTFRKPKMDDDIIASMDIGLDIEI